MILFNKKAFTLIEITIVMSLISLLLLLVYIPFSYQLNVVSTKNGANKLNQMINETKFLAYGGYVNKNGKNSNIGLYLEKGINKNKIFIVSYPYETTLNDMKDPYEIKNLNNNANGEIVREDFLDKNISVTNFPGSNNDKIMLMFKTVSGQLSILEKTGAGFTELSSSGLTITVGFKGMTDGNLSKIFFISK
ncbi:MAG: prepilin-type N-terminal cleavage/methylation domain-containing protein [Candidatus Gracilibacteria bacterium]|nr:prepilin-type N-terminal cleavage/methylation domain-containing protein [Candidatus Gracilibacteria bacterium]